MTFYLALKSKVVIYRISYDLYSSALFCVRKDCRRMRLLGGPLGGWLLYSFQEGKVEPIHLSLQSNFRIMNGTLATSIGDKFFFFFNPLVEYVYGVSLQLHVFYILACLNPLQTLFSGILRWSHLWPVGVSLGWLLSSFKITLVVFDNSPAFRHKTIQDRIIYFLPQS